MFLDKAGVRSAEKNCNERGGLFGKREASKSDTIVLYSLDETLEFSPLSHRDLGAPSALTLRYIQKHYLIKCICL